MKFDHYAIKILSPDDLNDYFELIERNRERLEDFFAGTVAITKTLEDTRIHLDDVVVKSETRDYFPFIVTNTFTGKPIASIQVKSIDWNIPKAELGYYIDKDYENKGIITRAVSLIIDFCFVELKLRKLFIRTYKDNIPSIRIATTNGFRLEGTIRLDYKTTSGKLVDLLYYGLIHYERNVVHERQGNKGAFRYRIHDEYLAEMAYTMAGDHLMIIEHTEVDERLRGKGIGKQLQYNLIDYVRHNDIMVIPVCPFAKVQFERMKEWRDVLKK